MKRGGISISHWHRYVLLFVGITPCYWLLYWVLWLGQDLQAFTRNTVVGFTVATYLLVGLVSYILHTLFRLMQRQQSQSKHPSIHLVWTVWMGLVVIVTLLFAGINC